MAELMGTHTPNKDDILQACLRNSCVSSLPINFAARFIKDFDAQSFVEELVGLILCQPYRGIMLR